MQQSPLRMASYATPWACPLTLLSRPLCQKAGQSSALTRSRALKYRRFSNSVTRKISDIEAIRKGTAGSKGPTAIVFMNMGGPSTTDEVGDFLSRLFVSAPVYAHMKFSIYLSVFIIPSISVLG